MTSNGSADLVIPGRGTVRIGPKMEPPPGFRGMMAAILPDGSLSLRIIGLSPAEVQELCIQIPKYLAAKLEGELSGPGIDR